MGEAPTDRRTNPSTSTSSPRRPLRSSGKTNSRTRPPWPVIIITTITTTTRTSSTAAAAPTAYRRYRSTHTRSPCLARTPTTMMTRPVTGSSSARDPPRPTRRPRHLQPCPTIPSLPPPIIPPSQHPPTRRGCDRMAITVSTCPGSATSLSLTLPPLRRWNPTRTALPCTAASRTNRPTTAGPVSARL